jgi:hypothetical protein
MPGPPSRPVDKESFFFLVLFIFLPCPGCKRPGFFAFGNIVNVELRNTGTESAGHAFTYATVHAPGKMALKNHGKRQALLSSQGYS